MRLSLIKSVIPYLEALSAKDRTSVLYRLFNETREVASTLRAADVVWVVGAPYCAEGVIWHRSQILFGNDERFRFPTKKRRHPMFTAMNASRVFMNRTLSTPSLKLLGLRRLDIGDNRKVVLITSFPLPGITDKPEVLLFDWTDFEVAGQLGQTPRGLSRPASSLKPNVRR